MQIIPLDDRSSNITYEGTWTLGGIPDEEFDGTTTYTDIAGSTATINFVGSQIGVFGTIREIGNGVPPKSSYSIDNGPLTYFTMALQSEKQYRQLFFQSQTLSSTQHSLEITCLLDNGRIILDLVNITASATITTTKSIAPVPTSLSTPLSNLSSISTWATEVSSMSNSASTLNSVSSPSEIILPGAMQNSPSQNRPVAKIVGGSLFGIFVIVFTTVGVICLKRKQKKDHQRIDTFCPTNIPSPCTVAKRDLTTSSAYDVTTESNLGLPPPYEP